MATIMCTSYWINYFIIESMMSYGPFRGKEKAISAAALACVTSALLAPRITALMLNDPMGYKTSAVVSGLSFLAFQHYVNEH